MALDTFVCMFRRPFAWREYLLQTWFVARVTLITGLSDVVVALIKATLFGLTAGLIACYMGISAGGGPAGVGNAVNETVVVSFGDAVIRYTSELIRLIAQMSLGTGALVMIGGTTAIVGFLTLSTGALV